MTSTPSQRMPWADVPGAVRDAVGDILGSPVTAAQSQSGGFSPGSADRVVTASGRRAFVKTAWDAVNADAPVIHRREAAVHDGLPAGLPVPALLGLADLDDWVAIVFEDVEGRHPTTPWRHDELFATLDALEALGSEPVAQSAAPALEDEVAALFDGWSGLTGRTDELLPSAPAIAAWVAPRMAGFAAASLEAVADLRGDRLVHLDVRADNLLIRPDGGVVLVDWPWAARGVSWFDALALLVNVRYFDATADVEEVIRCHRVFAAMPREAATRTLIGLAGYFLARSMDPPAPGIPTLRAFQRDQAIATLEWLRERGA